MESRKYQRHVRIGLTDDEVDEMVEVNRLAELLRARIERDQETIAELHVFNAQSSALQRHFSILLHDELGFVEEQVMKPQDGFVTHARPDFIHYLDRHHDRGIIAEVERGGTTTNNHDLKDFWKAHIASNAHHLFLIVPMNNWKKDGTPREKPFPIVARRLGAFFGDERRQIDVVSAHVFGY